MTHGIVSDGQGAAAAAMHQEEPLSSLLLYTHNVARVLKPSQHGELAHAVHETLHYALDGNPQDYLIRRHSEGASAGQTNGGCGEASTSTLQSTATSVQGSQANANEAAHRRGAKDDDETGDDRDAYEIQGGFFPTDDDDRPFISFDWAESTRQLTLPHPKTVTNPILSDPCTSAAASEKELRQEFDVTAKFFYLQGEETRLQPDGTSIPPEQDFFHPKHINDALTCLARGTGLGSVDTMILAFPTLHLDKKGADGQNVTPASNDIARVARVWQHISSDERIGHLGLSDFSRTSLAATLEHLCPPQCPEEEKRQVAEAAAASAAIEESMVKHPDGASAQTNGQAVNKAELRESTDPADPLGMHNEQPREDLHGPVRIPSSPSKASLVERLSKGGEEEIRKAYGPSPCRRPRLCTINLREQSCDDDALGRRFETTIDRQRNGSGNGACCCWDRGLADLCREENILLVAHSDQRDILPRETLPTLLNEFTSRLPHPLPAGKSLAPVWCLKYTVLIRDRGVLADKGFILYTKVV